MEVTKTRMEKKAQTSGIMILGVIVAVIIGLVGLSITADLTSLNIEAQAANNELVTGSNITDVQFDNTNWATNATCNCSPFTADFVPGTAIWGNDSCNGVGVLCSYTYYDPAYVENSTTQTIIGLFIILFAVLILVLITAGIVMR